MIKHVDRKLLGVVLSLTVAVMVWFAPLPGPLSQEGRLALAVTLFTVIWWVLQIIPPAYSTLMMLLAYIIFGLATPADVFQIWTMPLLWLIVGSFLIAAAVAKSGLAERVAAFFVVRFANSYRSLIVLTYVLGFVLSILIPHPFPRALLLMSLMRAIIRMSGMNVVDAASVGLSVFVATTATSTILLTGDSTLNLAAVGFAGVSIGWLEWPFYMAVPGLIASLLMLGLHLLVFRQTGPIAIDHTALERNQAARGPMTRAEKATLGWLAVALVLWMTDALHGIDPAWVGLMAVVGLALPVVGGVLEAQDLSSGVNWPILFFVTGALAIGTVSRITGLSDWLAATLLPAVPPQDPWSFAALVAGTTMLIHMLLGSALASMSIIAPPMVHYAVDAGWSPLFPALLIYSAVALHYLFPFHHVVILLGQGDLGGYRSRQVLSYGLPLTLVVLVVIVGVEVTWWRLIGLV